MRKPIFLFADSQLLFRIRNGSSILDAALAMFGRTELRAAYIGANNNDQPEYYEIFLSAMIQLGISDCRFVSMKFIEEDRNFLETADLILIAGGEANRGWEVIKLTGMSEQIVQRYLNGAMLIGVSAGAVQLGLYSWGDALQAAEMMKLIPLIIDVHDEKDDWRRLQRILKETASAQTGIGIPFGGGMIYHADHTVEALRKPLYEFRIEENGLRQHLLFPDEHSFPASREME